MKRSPTRRKEGFLIILVVFCLGYAALLHFHFPLTGTHQLDGILGVLLGLYSASQPAASILDLILYGRYESVRIAYRQTGRVYWVLNFFVLFAGWVVISTSLLRYSELI